MISRRKEDDLKGLKKIENMKIDSDPFIVRSIININRNWEKITGKNVRTSQKANGKQQGLCFIRNTGSV